MRHNNKPNLLVLTSSFPRSPGDETCGYVRDFARSLAGEFNVTVLAPADHDWAPSDEPFVLRRSRSILPSSLDPFQATADLNELISTRRLTKALTAISLASFFVRALFLALRADAICSHWMVPSGFVGALISRATGKPHVVIEHSGALHLLTRARGGRSLVRLIVGGADRVVTVSRDLKTRLIALCPDASRKVEVIAMGVGPAAAAEEPASNGPVCENRYLTVLFIGRLTQIKGLDVLLKAMRGLEASRLIVAGDGPERESLERLARECSVDAVFAGHVDATRRRTLLSSCDVVVIPSRVLADGRSEGTPVVCLEAFCAGRAVVASRVGGLNEIIVDGQNGLLCDPDDHSMLRDKLRLVLNDRLLRREIAENARRTSAAYTWSNVGPKFAKVIRTALQERSAMRLVSAERPSAPHSSAYQVGDGDC